MVWTNFAASPGDDTDSFSVQARRFGGPVIFGDDFESGDLCAWSATVP